MLSLLLWNVSGEAPPFAKDARSIGSSSCASRMSCGVFMVNR